MNYRDVYGDVLADHHESPRNWGKLSEPCVSENGFNPLCGDRVELSVRFQGETLDSCAFQGEGCSICMASASIMTEMAMGQDRTELKALVQAFRDKMAGKTTPAVEQKLPADQAVDQDVVALYGIQKFPVRIKCALLPWTTLNKILEKEEGAVA